MNPKDKHADWLLKPTANELADYLEDNGVHSFIDIRNAVDLLRQQQAEINVLKAKVAFLEENSVMLNDDSENFQFRYKYLDGEDMLEAQRRINNMLRQMIDELPVKDKP